MSNNIEFVDGLRVYAPHERAPDYIIANVQVDSAQLSQWLASHPGQQRLVIKRSKGGKYYAQVDTYKRDAKPQEAARPTPSAEPPSGEPFEDSDIPF